MQKPLAPQQVAAFYHDSFVQHQVEHFKALALPYILNTPKVVVDVGGGCGYFAQALKKEFGVNVRVIDMDPLSVEKAKALGVCAEIGDALSPKYHHDEGVACFNLILHHLVGSTEKETMRLQGLALSPWREKDVKIFINEYIYESWLLDISSRFIYEVTKNKILSSIGKLLSKLMPSLNANTFGVGVRFRSNKGWKAIFKESGLSVVSEQRGEKEFISLPRRLLLIKEIRRDSFILTPSK